MSDREKFLQVLEEVDNNGRVRRCGPLSTWEAAAIVDIARTARRAGLAGGAIRGFRITPDGVLPAYGYMLDGADNTFVISGDTPPVFVAGGSATCLADIIGLITEFMVGVFCVKVMRPGLPEGVYPVVINMEDLAKHFRAAGVPDKRGELARGVIKEINVLAKVHAGPQLQLLGALAAKFGAADAAYRRGDEEFTAWLAENA